ncbi:MAG: nucleotide exchange factor GrpE [Oscillospiraceae bacterium]
MSNDTNRPPESEQENPPVTPAEEAAPQETEAAAETAGKQEDAGTPGEKKAEKKKQEETFTLTKAQMEKLEAVAKELEKQKEQFLRLAAEYDNYRKRTVKEKESIYNNAKTDTITAMLPVYDNLERGIAGLEEGDPHRQGIEMILKQFKESLTRLGVSEMDCLGQPFDPERMNAVMHVEDESAGENTVVEIFQKGFTLGGKVLRVAVVKVAN